MEEVKKWLKGAWVWVSGHKGLVLVVAVPLLLIALLPSLYGGAEKATTEGVTPAEQVTETEEGESVLPSATATPIEDPTEVESDEPVALPDELAYTGVTTAELYGLGFFSLVFMFLGYRLLRRQEGRA